MPTGISQNSEYVDGLIDTIVRLRKQKVKADETNQRLSVALARSEQTVLNLDRQILQLKATITTLESR